MAPEQDTTALCPAAGVDIGADGVALVRISAGGPLNIIGSATALSLAAQLRALARNEAVRAVVILGTGSKTFVGGADIRELATLAPASARRFISALHAMCEAARDLPVPSLCAIPGWCIGVGLELAAACDIRMAAADAQFVMPEVRIGIPSVIHAALLSHLIGEGRARWLMLTGEPIDAPQAQAWGLVTEVLPQPQLEDAALRLARDLAQLAPEGMRAQKRVLRASESPHLDASMAHSIELFGAAYESADPARLMQAFLARKGRAH